MQRHVRSQLLPDHWRVICSFLPVGGPDGQWRIKQVCKGLMSADVDTARCEWNERYKRFIADLRMEEGDKFHPEFCREWHNDTHSFRKGQRELLGIMARQVVRLFRPPEDRMQLATLNLTIKLQGITGVTTARTYFQRALLAHTPPSIRIFCAIAWYMALDYDSDVQERLTHDYHEGMGSPVLPAIESAYHDLVIYDDAHKAQTDATIPTRTGGVAIHLMPMCRGARHEYAIPPIEISLHSSREQREIDTIP